MGMLLPRARAVPTPSLASAHAIQRVSAPSLGAGTREIAKMEIRNSKSRNSALVAGSRNRSSARPWASGVSAAGKVLSGRRCSYHAKLGVQSGVVRDTTGVTGADQIIYQFKLDGENIVRRVQPDSGQAILKIPPSGDVMTWVIARIKGLPLCSRPTV